MVESWKFKPLDSGSAVEVLELIGPDALSVLYNELLAEKQAWLTRLLAGGE
jgi:hypothetical protein